MPFPPAIRETDMPEDRHEVLEQRFNSHLDEYRRHIEDDRLRWEECLKMAEANTIASKETNIALEELTRSTQGLVNLQTTGQTIAKIGVWVKNIMIFVVGATFMFKLDWLAIATPFLPN